MIKKIFLLLSLGIAFILFTSFLTAQDNDYKDIVLKVAMGVVEKGYVHDDNIIYDRVRPGIILEEGEYLKTSSDANATIQIGETVIKLDESTVIILEYAKAGGTELRVINGSLFTKVNTLIDGGVFKVNSPSAVAGVRGTSFRFSYNLKTTEGAVMVNNGIVEVGNETVRNKSVLLNRNQKISLKAGIDPTDAKIEDIKPEVKSKSANDFINDKPNFKFEISDMDLDKD